MLARSVHPAGWSLVPYEALVSGDVFWRVMGITLEIGAVVTGSCLLLAVPLAYWLARMPPARANLLLLVLAVTAGLSRLLGTRAVLPGAV